MTHACWKTPYRRARSARTVVKARQREDGIELHVYKCGFCGHYHLTPKAPTTFRAQVAK